MPEKKKQKPEQNIKQMILEWKETCHFLPAAIFLALLYLIWLSLTSRKHVKELLHEKEHQIEEEKHLSETDRLTGIGNRRAYEEDLKRYKGTEAEENLIYMSADVNGLKVVNDTFGHESGDTLLKGAAEVLERCIGIYGKLYRIGGDEFAALFFADSERLELIRADLNEATLNWMSPEQMELSIACGFVAKKEFPDKTMPQIARIADERMYAAKTAYYMHKGIDRRGQQAAYKAICASYTKILKIDLTNDSYKIIYMDTAEQTKEKGFSEQISVWLHDFGTSGQVSEEDLPGYLEATSLSALRQYFLEGKNYLSIFYRRSRDSVFRQTMMELIPAEDYTPEEQKLYLYVKDIDR